MHIESFLYYVSLIIFAELDIKFGVFGFLYWSDKSFIHLLRTLGWVENLSDLH